MHIPKVISEILKESRYENQNKLIEFELNNNVMVSSDEDSGIEYEIYTADVKVSDKNTGEVLRFPMDLVKSPILTNAGYLVKGSYRQVVSDYVMSEGYYFNEADNKFPSRYLSCKSIGFNIKVYVRNNELIIVGGKKGRVKKIPLAVFLKAITNKSYTDLALLLGPNSLPVALSFDPEKEPTYVECLAEVLTTIFDTRAGRSQTVSKMSVKELKAELDDRLYNLKYVDLGYHHMPRLISSTSFKERCNGLILEEDISVNGYSYSKGSLLTVRDLEELDYLPVESLEVSTLNKKRYTIRKTYSNNFRVLGRKLLQAVQVNEKVFPVGTVLTTLDLTIIEGSMVRTLVVEGDTPGSVIYSNRTSLRRNFKVNDFISILQAYIDFYNGVFGPHQISSLVNQNMVDMNYLCVGIVRQNCESVIETLAESKFELYEDSDLIVRAMESLRVSTDGLIEHLLNSRVKEVQTAEINNTLQWKSKQMRASKSAERATDSMVEISVDQQPILNVFDTPESRKVGMTQVRTINSIINNSGNAAALFTIVNDGEITDTEVYLTADKYKGLPIASWDETFKYIDENGVEKKKKFVTCFMDGEIVTANVEDVKCMFHGPYAIMSPAHADIPFSEHEAAKRITMGGNHKKSSHITLKGERPLVSSGGSSLLRDGIFTVERILNEKAHLYPRLAGLSEAQLETLSLLLVNKRVTQGNMHLRFMVLGELPEVSDGTLTIEYSVLYGLKSSTGGLYSTKIKYNSDRTYRYHDVVVTTTDYVSDDTELNLQVNTGTMKVDPAIFQESQAKGVNLLVALKTNELCTIDDSVTINRRLIGDDTLTSVVMEQIDYELRDPRPDVKAGTEEVESFTELSWCRSDLPPNNSVISPKQEVIKVLRQTRNIISGDTTSMETVSIVYEGLEEVKVISSEIKNNVATVLVARTNSIERGDKLSGSHGDKSVVAKILEEAEMPFIEETGEIVDIFVNPQSLPSRMNVAILIEGSMGLVAGKQGKPIIFTPFKGKALDYALELRESAGITQYKMINGKTGLAYDRPVEAIRHYFYKSEHHIDKKIKYVGDDTPRDPKFNQPSKGVGGQASGDYELWVYASVGANKLIQTIYSSASTDTMGALQRKDAIQNGKSLDEVSSNNFSDLYMQINARVEGIELELNDNFEVSFSPLKDEMIRSLSPSPIPPGALDRLRSPEIFGNPKIRRNDPKWGWLELGVEIINPVILIDGSLEKFILASRMRRELDAKGYKFKRQTDYIFLNKKDMTELIYEKANLYLTSNGPVLVSTQLLKEYEEALDSGKEILEDELGSIIRTSEVLVGIKAVVHLFREANLQAALETYEGWELGDSKAKREIGFKVGSLLRQFISSGRKLSDFIISSYPVIPIFFRPESVQKGVFQEYDYYYRRIMEVANKCISSPGYNPTLARELLERITDLIGVKFSGYPVDEEIRTKYKPIRTFFSTASGDKKGANREKILKVRTLHSGRTPIIPNNDASRTPKELGIPFIMAVEIWKTHLVKHFSERYEDLGVSSSGWKKLLSSIGMSTVEFNRAVLFHLLPVGISMEEAYEFMHRDIRVFVEGINRFGENEQFADFEVVSAGRQPTLHKFSIAGFRPYLVNHKCIEIHPLLCPAYNADFDGDQMWVKAWFSEEEKKELLDKFSPEHSTLNPKDGSVVLKPSQDIILGLYYLTMLKDNVVSFNSDFYKDTHLRFYSDLDSLKSDLEVKAVMPYDLVIFNYKGRMYPATAGRVLFNGLLPNMGAFTGEIYEDHSAFPLLGEKILQRCYKLKYDGLIANPKGKISARKIKVSKLTSMIKEVIQGYSTGVYMKFIQSIGETGFYYADRSGISISVEDFKQREETQRIISKADKVSQSIDKRFRLGLLSEEERKSERIAIYTKAKELVMVDYLTHIEHNNNLFIMFESGARGDEGQITQAAAMVGVLQKNSNETLEFPVRSSYISGLTMFEMLLSAYPARQAIKATQLETANAGEVSRKSVYILEGMKVVEPDCGVGFRKVPLMFKEFSSLALEDEKDISLDINLLKGKTLDAPSYAFTLLKNFLEEGKLTDKCISLLIKNKVQRIVVEGVKYQLLYRMDPLFDSLYYYRNAKDLPGLLKGKFISEGVLEYISKEQPEGIMVRDMFGCRSIGGICQACYGAQYDTVEEPPLGLGIPIISGQAIGEPSTQLTMNTHKKGGAAGASLDDAVEFVKNILDSGRIYKESYTGCAVSPVSGYLDISDDGSYILVPDKEVNQKTLQVDNNWIVPDSISHFKLKNPSSLYGPGEYIPEYTIMTEGLPQIRYEVHGENDDYFRFNQMNLLRIIFDVYETSGLDVYARHFEILVRALTSFVMITSSNDPEIIKGKLCDRMKAEASIAAGNEIEFISARTGALTTNRELAGPLSAIMLADRGQTLDQVITSQSKYKINSIIGKVALGQPVDEEKPKPLLKIKITESIKSMEEEVPQANYLEILTQKIEKAAEVTVNAPELDLTDLDSLFSNEELEEDNPLVDTSSTSFEDMIPAMTKPKEEVPTTDITLDVIPNKADTTSRSFS